MEEQSDGHDIIRLLQRKRHHSLPISKSGSYLGGILAMLLAKGRATNAAASYPELVKGRTTNAALLVLSL
jgi:hypothetical protein